LLRLSSPIRVPQKTTRRSLKLAGIDFLVVASADQSMDIVSLFADSLACPTCGSANWLKSSTGYICQRCDYEANVDGRFISLLPDTLSANNEREAGAYDTKDADAQAGLLAYVLEKPWNYPKVTQENYLRAARKIADLGKNLGPSASVLFVFGGGGMEAHMSGLLGPNVVLADISNNLLRLAEQRFDHYKVPQPAALIQCDAEKLPFKNRSFDFVVGFEGIHHCMVPQSALNEIWRVARKQTFIIDNLECAITRLLFRFGQSSQIEGTGVKPNRFTICELQTMLFNAGIERYDFQPRTALPDRVFKIIGSTLGRLLERFMDKSGQANMFMLTTFWD
jgi:SAM-dependent methyltransferase